METGIYQVKLLSEGLCTHEKLAQVEHPTQLMRFNDGRCDRQGRFFSGTMFNDTKAGMRVGSFYRFNNDYQLTRLWGDLIVPNGLAFSPDGPAMCAFGGNNLDTLFVTSLKRPGISEEEDPHAGRIFALQLSVKGLAEPQFKNTPIA